MPRFNKISKEKLASCHPDLQKVFNEVIKYFDCTIIEGHRGKEAQNKAYEDGKSELKWPKGKHNSIPSNAVDVAPYPVNWKDLNRIYYFAGFVVAMGIKLNVAIRWGGDWDSDTEVLDNTFNDLVHFELGD